MASELLDRNELLQALANESANKEGKTDSGTTTVPTSKINTQKQQESFRNELLSGSDLNRNSNAEGGSLATASVSSGYYSRPELWTKSESLYNKASEAQVVAKEKESACSSAASTLNEIDECLAFWTQHLQILQDRYQKATNQQNGDMLTKAQDQMKQIMTQFLQAQNSYDTAYAEYTSACQKYNDAANAYNGYIENQQKQFDTWKATIRDSATVKQEIDSIDAQISELKKDDAISNFKAFTSNTTAGMATTNSGLSPVSVDLGNDKSAQIRKLEEMMALLQEEYDWSQYYKYADLMDAEDFSEKSKYVSTANGKERSAIDIMMGNYSTESSGWEDPLYEYINGNEEAGAYISNAAASSYGSDNAIGAIFGRSAEGKTESQQMTEDEIATFNYLYATQGKEAAHYYYDYLLSDLNYRQRKADEEYWSNYAAKDPIGSSVFSLAISPAKGLSYLGQTADYVSDGTIDQNAAYNKFSYIPSTIREKVPENWGPVGSFAYQTGMSMADFLLSTAITGGNQAAALAIMGTGAAADATISAKDRGLSDSQSFALGTIAGLAEVITEKVSLETLLNPDLLKNGAGKYILKNMLAEGSEEVGSDLINLFADIIVSKDKSEWQKSIDAYVADGKTEEEAFGLAIADQAVTMGLDFLGGAISGGLMGGGGAIAFNNNTKKLGSELGELDLDKDDIQEFINTGLESDPKTASYQLAMEMQAKIEAGETLSNYDLSRLYQANVQAQPEARWVKQEEQEPTVQTSTQKKQEEADSLSEAIAGQWEGEGSVGEVSANTLLTQAKADLKAGEITDAEFDAIMDDVMHLEELEDGTSVKTFDSQTDVNTQSDNINVNVNGGTTYGNIQEQSGQPAAAQPAGEFGTTRADIPDGVQIRDAGESSGVQVGQVASGTRGQGAQTNSQAKAVIERQNTAGDLRQRGLISYTSSWTLGIESGTNTENLLVMPEEHFDAEMQQAAQLAKAETGLNVAFTVGNIQINRNGITREVRGVHTGQQIVAQCDNAKATAMQLVKHEIFHDKAMKDPGLTQRLKEEIQERFTPQEFDAVMDRYIDELWPLYGPTDETAWEEYEGAYNAILEEMLADAYAGINAFSAHAERFTETVNELTPAKTVDKQQKQENGTEESTGPPDNRYSTDDENSSVKQQMADNQDVLNAMDPVARISVPHSFLQLDKAGKQNWIVEKLRPTGYKVDRRGFGIIDFAKKRLKSAFNYFRKGSAEEAVFEALPRVLEKGIEISTHADHKGREYGTVTIAAPITVNGKRGNMAVVVKQTTANFYKVHRILSPDGSAFLLLESEEAEPTSGGGVTQKDPLATPIGSASATTIQKMSGNVKERFSYAGENANNADLDALARAKEMQAAGVADETIRQQTGWHTGMDGKWRWEIDDSKMQYTSRGDLGLRERRPGYARYRELLDKSNRYVLELSDEALTPEETAELQKLKEIWGGTFRKAGRITEDALPTDLLSDYVKHDDLFEAYPQLRKTRLRFADLPEGTRGQYDPEQDVITLSESLRGKPQDTLIHEIQHVIQKAEGFSRGSSVEYWAAKLAADRQREVELADKKYREIFDSMPEELKAKVRAYNRANLDYDYDEAIAIENELLESEYGELFSAWQDADFERRNLRERYKDNRFLTEDAITNYWNTAGEIEARDAASRRRLTAEQRRSAEPARADDRTVFVEDIDDTAFTELDAQYGTQLQSAAEFDQDTISSNLQQVAQMKPVTSISGQEFAKGEVDLITQVETFFNQRGNRAYSPELGEVVLDRKGVKSDIGHGNRQKKAAAFAAVPDVIEHGLVVDYQKDWKGRGYDTAVVAAPITIGDQTHAAAVILLRSDQTNRFYVHEVLAMENGALPFKTGTREGYPGGDAPSILSILERIRSVKNGSASQERFSTDDKDASGTNELRQNMTTKEREILRGVETRLLRNIGGALSVTKFGDRSYLKSVIQSLSDTYLETGTIEQQTMDNLFEQAYRQGIVVDRELHDQYEEVRKYLRTVSLTLDPRDRSDIADYRDFVKNMRGKMRIVNEGGLPVDSAWHKLNDMAPELFPDSIAHPADQLVRMTEVLDSLRIVERSVGEYYGSMASTYKKDAKAEFERAVWESIGELRQIRRYEQERQQKLQETEPAPTTPEEAMEAWTKLKSARKTYEKAMAKNLLTTEDEIAVGDLLKGKMLLEHLDKDKLNVKGILAVYEAKQEYEHLTKLLAEYRRKVKADIRAEADSYLETANTWKDKDIGLLYSREIMQRNVEDIVPDKKLAKRINERYFEPVRDAEAAAVKMKEGYREAVRKLNLSRDVKKGNLVSEAHAVQLYGEAMDNIRILEKARGRLKHRDGKSLEEWRGVVYKLWQENPGLDKAKIESAVAEMRQIYDELFRKMNEVRVRWGYEPVNYRQGYFPHFQPGDGDGIMAQFGRVLGIDTQVVALPTTINGLTHTFKPGIQWFGNAQERLGFNTAYDAVEGFDRYIEGVASVICQTENIQRLRALASQIRYRTSDEGIRKQVDAIYSNAALTEEQKNDAISGIYEKGRYTLSNFVVEVDEYTNLLANKKSKLDRTVEALIGRKFYTAMKWLESRVGANMIAGNVTSALTNFIPLTQASAQLSKKAMLQGMWDTLASYKTDDGIIDRSAFLTNRRGSDPLVKVWSAKVSEVLGKPMELIDSFTSGSIVRAAYYQNLKQGLSESEAMHQADIFASRVMAERSKGGMPTLFESKNPFFKLFTQFQLEVNNQWSEVFKDIPRLHREKGLAALALIFLQYFLGAWLFNNLYEKWIGRRPAMDPIDIVLDTAKDFVSDDVSTTDALGNLANNVLEELPFSSALTLIGIETDGGRVPVSSGIPNIPTLVTAATNEDWAPEKRWKEAQDELNKLAYVIPPFGGNQVSKIWKGIKAYIEGGSYSVDSAGNDILQYPVYNDESGDFWGLVQAMLLGKSSLPEAKEWVEDGFDSLSAKQTAIYQDMIDSGVSEREAYDLIDSLRSASETEDASKKEVQINILQDAEASDECKAIAFYGLLATDNERLLMDSLTDSGAMPGPVMDVLIQLRDAAALPSAEEKVAQADILNEASLTESEKEIVIRSWLDDQEVNENGNLTSLGKFNLAMKQGITTEEYLRFRATGMEIDKLLEYTQAGFEADEAQDLAQAIHDLDPLPGEDRVSTLQKWRASVDFSDDVEDQLTALSMIMEPKSLAVWETANDYGVAPDVYVTFQETGAQYDADGNGSYTQAEAKAVIDAEFSHLTTAQKAVLWQWVCYSSGSKNNPYDPTVGQNFIDSRDTAKAAAEE